MNRNLIIILLLLLSCSVAAQKVTNVVAFQEGKTIVITYDLSENAIVNISGTASTNSRIMNDYLTLKMYTVKGDVGKFVHAGKGKRIVWDVLQDYGEKFMYQNVKFHVSARPTMKTFIVAEGAYSFSPQWGAGIMVGQVRRWGWFLKFRSNYQFKALQSTQYEAQENGVVKWSGWADGDGFYDYKGVEVTPFYSGKQTKTELIVDAGTIVRLGCPLHLYFGGGFGARQVQWQTTDEQWIKYAPGSVMGFSGDIGLLASIHGFVISAGVNTINFKYMEIEAGLGWMF